MPVGALRLAGSDRVFLHDFHDERRTTMITKRTTTGYKGINFNRKTKKNGVTLSMAWELWENKAIAQNLSPVTILNNKDQFRMITKSIPADTLIGDITEDDYYEFAVKSRSLGYSEETIMLINGTLRKLINLCYKRQLINDNILTHCDNIRTVKKEDYRVISFEEYTMIDAYLEEKASSRAGNNDYYRFLFALLYYTGIRIGEAMALTYDDFKAFTYASGNTMKSGYRMSITKSYVSKLGIVKVPKNFKFRQIPVVSHPAELFEKYKEGHEGVSVVSHPAELYEKYREGHEGISGTSGCSRPDHHGKDKGSRAGRICEKDRAGCSSGRICPVTYTPIDNALKCACADLGLPAYHLHEFRHSYISYLISKNIPLSVIEKLSGDTQNTILTRYSHCFGNGESAVIDALEELK